MEGINNKLWGPVYWRMFHYVTLSYPIKPKDENKKFIKNFFTEIVPNILPCPLCRNHYKENLKLNPLNDDILELKLKLVIWLINMHNYVNIQLGKSEISIEESLIMLFLPIELDNKCEEEENNNKYNQKYLENTFISLVDTDDLIIDINKIISEKEEDIENENILIMQENAKKEKIKELYEKKNLLNHETKRNYEKKKEQFDANMQEIKNKLNLQVNILQVNKGDNKGDNKDENINQQFIDINKIIEKMFALINTQKNNKNRYLMYTAFETICLLFV